MTMDFTPDLRRFDHVRDRLKPGVFVVNLERELDSDEHGEERWTGVGTLGWIADHNNNDVWDVAFANGAAICPTSSELLDPAQYNLFVKE